MFSAKIRYICAGFVFLIIGTVGGLLPAFPGIIFLGLATYCFKRGLPWFDVWLHQLPIIGLQLTQWEDNRSIALSTKVCTVIMFLCTVPPSLYFFVSSDIMRVLVLIVSVSMCTYILTRPTSKKENTASE